MWKAVVSFMHELFPGQQLEVLLEMFGLFIVMVVFLRLRAEQWGRCGLGSIVFLTEQKFQTLFSDERVKQEASQESSGEETNTDSSSQTKAPR
jgi:hypothetical protein